MPLCPEAKQLKKRAQSVAGAMEAASRADARRRQSRSSLSNCSDVDIALALPRVDVARCRVSCRWPTPYMRAKKRSRENQATCGVVNRLAMKMRRGGFFRATSTSPLRRPRGSGAIQLGSTQPRIRLELRGVAPLRLYIFRRLVEMDVKFKPDGATNLWPVFDASKNAKESVYHQWPRLRPQYPPPPNKRTTKTIIRIISMGILRLMAMA
jgi:hypothetical protein